MNLNKQKQEQVIIYDTEQIDQTLQSPTFKEPPQIVDKLPQIVDKPPEIVNKPPEIVIEPEKVEISSESSVKLSSIQDDETNENLNKFDAITVNEMKKSIKIIQQASVDTTKIWK